jgi:methyl coenzyme M reductase beta subunit
LGNETAPFVYFDGIPTYGTMHGAIQIELAAHTILPADGGGTSNGHVVTCHLRCSPFAAAALRDALDKSIGMFERSLQPPSENAPQAPTSGRLN